MCDCISKVEQNVLERSKEKYPDSIISEGMGCAIDGTGIQEKAIGINGNFLYLTQKFLKSDKKKDGTYTKPKKVSVNVFINYCPFCGEKYE